MVHTFEQCVLEGLEMFDSFEQAKNVFFQKRHVYPYWNRNWTYKVSNSDQQVSKFEVCKLTLCSEHYCRDKLLKANRLINVVAESHLSWNIQQHQEYTWLFHKAGWKKPSVRHCSEVAALSHYRKETILSIVSVSLEHELSMSVWTHIHTQQENIRKFRGSGWWLSKE